MTATVPAASGAARFVGRSVPRVHDQRLVSGRGRYVADITPPGTVHAVFVRSPVARATIVSIDVERALSSPGVVAVLTGADLNPHLQGDMHGTPYLGHSAHAPLLPLAEGRVTFVGEPVVLVVARDRYLAEDAAELVDIEYEALTPVLDYETAADETELLVYPERGTNIAERFGAPLSDELRAVFASAPHVITQTFRQHRQTPVPMETRGVTAAWSPTDRELLIHMSTQFPQEAREVAGRITGVPLHQVRVLIGDVGGGFGQKAYVPTDEQAVILAAKVLGRTIKWIEDRQENLTAATQGRHEQMTVTMALDDDGVILGAYIDHLADIGAHPVFATGGGAVFVCYVFPGPYRIPSFGYQSTAVFTNTCSRGAYRGPWQMESVAREAMMDHVARELSIDPIELRRRNVLHRSELPYASPGGLTLDGVSPEETLEQAVEVIDYPGFRAMQAEALEQGRLLGLGTGLYIEPQPGAVASEGITITVTPTGVVELAQSSGDHGQGLTTTSAQLVADALGVHVNDVVITQGDTAATPYGSGTGGSRSGPMLSAAVLEASGKLRELILEHAADQLEADVSDLTISDGTVGVVGTTSGITLADLARSAYGASGSSSLARGLSVVNYFDPPVPVTFSNACHICTVEVDPFTGVTKILRFVVSEDCGNMINPAIVDGQIAGGVVQGIGGALYEHVPYDESGNPLAGTFLDYLIPTIAEVPTIEIHHLSTPSLTPGGFKGVGEGGVIGAVPAVLNAVADALAGAGARIADQPLFPERVRSALLAATADSVAT